MTLDFFHETKVALWWEGILDIFFAAKNGTAVFLVLCVVDFPVAQIAEVIVKPTLVKYQHFTEEKNTFVGLSTEFLCVYFL